jgi:hypothetical protein
MFFNKKRSTSLIATSLLLFILNSTARAALHENAHSIADDKAALSADMITAQWENYSVHTLTLPSGTVVKEFVSLQGLVFAVTWNGPFMPKLRKLLGRHGVDYENAAALNVQKSSPRGPFSSRSSELVIETGGHLRAYVGRAYLPQMLPNGLSEEDIKW